jgi:hypothetical protein
MKDVHFELHQEGVTATAVLTVPCTVLASVLASVYEGEIPIDMQTGNPEIGAYRGRMDVYFLRIGATPMIHGSTIWRTEARALKDSEMEALTNEATKYEGKRVMQALGLLPGWPRTSRVKVADALAALWGATADEVKDMLEVEVLYRIRPLLDRNMLDRAAAAERRFRYVGPPYVRSTVQ